jgi:hypothetical protein
MNHSSEMTCQRCGKKPCGTWTCSMFNTQRICMECKAKERVHPRYREAVEADNEAIRTGNYRFPGIGLPPELEGGGRGEEDQAPREGG